MKSKFIKGISIIEILLIIAILGIALASLSGLVRFSLVASNLIKQTTQANSLAQGTMEAVRNFRDQTSWDVDGLGTLTLDIAYHPEKTIATPSQWSLVSGDENIGKFTRKVAFKKVYRDGNDDIADSGTEDLNTKKAIVTVSWEEKGKTHSLELETYFTNWQE